MSLSLTSTSVRVRFSLLSGPETVNVVPPAQFLTSYQFFTDPTYGYTDVALVRSTSADVTLDCLGTVTGWQPIGGSPYQYVHVDLQHAGAPVGKCDNGLHTISSTAPFGSPCGVTTARRATRTRPARA